MKKSKSIAKNILICFCLAVLFSLSFSSAHGYCMTQEETKESITIPIEQWNALKNEVTLLDKDLTEYRSELSKAKKPSQELQKQLQTAEKMLKQLQEQLSEQSNDLTMLRKESDELKTLSATLKQRIEKERKIHKRQVWQNRFWCLILGAGIGVACSK